MILNLGIWAPFSITLKLPPAQLLGEEKPWIDPGIPDAKSALVF